MTQKIIDLGKSSVQYILTMIFAAIGVYVGLRVNETEQKMINQYQNEAIKELKYDRDILWNTTFNLQIDNAIICEKLGINRTRGTKSEKE
jgi:hypothetical protein